MSVQDKPVGLARRERKGREKRQIGVKNIQRMLPNRDNWRYGGEAPPGRWAADLSLMGMEDSYCDMWDRTEVIDLRTRSLFNVSLMTGVGNICNSAELEFHGPGAFYNGVTLDELEQLVVTARAYVGSAASAFASTSIAAALRDHKILEGPRPAPDTERREKTGSEKRAIGRQVLSEMEPDSPLLKAPEGLPKDVFASELDLMVLENVYFDLWARTDIFDRRTRSVVVLGLLMALPNHAGLRAHIPAALRNGLTIPELEELVYQAATYLGHPNGLSIRETVRQGLEDAGAI